MKSKLVSGIIIGLSTGIIVVLVLFFVRVGIQQSQTEEVSFSVDDEAGRRLRYVAMFANNQTQEMQLYLYFADENNPASVSSYGWDFDNEDYWTVAYDLNWELGVLQSGILGEFEDQQSFAELQAYLKSGYCDDLCWSPLAGSFEQFQSQMLFCDDIVQQRMAYADACEFVRECCGTTYHMTGVTTLSSSELISTDDMW